LSFAAHQGLSYVHPFDDLAVIAGQGTLALEALLAEPDIDAFVVPVGGGGLLAGVATVVKSLRPDVRVIGVEPAHAAGLAAARQAGRPVRTATLPTLADGLAVALTGAHPFAHAQAFVDDVVTVSEDDLALALLAAHEAHGVMLEGAGATALAACLAGRLPDLSGKRVLVALTGANIDPANHARALRRARVLRAEQVAV
jgi:threonine dehydratase